MLRILFKSLVRGSVIVVGSFALAVIGVHLTTSRDFIGRVAPVPGDSAQASAEARTLVRAIGEYTGKDPQLAEFDAANPLAVGTGLTEADVMALARTTMGSVSMNTVDGPTYSIADAHKAFVQENPDRRGPANMVP